MLVKNPNFSQKKPNISSKIQILAKNQNIGQKSKFCPKPKILAKNRNFGQKSKYQLQILNISFSPYINGTIRFPKNYSGDPKPCLILFYCFTLIASL